MTNKEFENKKWAYEHYVRERADFHKALLEAGGRYDRTLITLASGVIALSVAFLEKIAPNGISQRTLYFLGVAWLCMLVCIILELLALHFSTKTAQFEIQRLDEVYAAEESGISVPDEEKNHYVSKVNRCNGLSLLLFAVGTVLMLLSVYKSVKVI